MLKLITSHNKTAGFFSNCSVRLKQIINFINENNEFPQIVDSSVQFRNYKKNSNDNKEDLTNYFFEKTVIPAKVENINYFLPLQYQRYKNIDFKNIEPLTKAFFSPSVTIKNIIEKLEKKYKLDHDNMCSVYYRGNDKYTETGIANYEEFFNKAKEIQKKNSNIKFLIQTDELEFAEAFKQRFPNSFWFDESSMINHDPSSSVHHSLPRNERKEHASYFFAATLIMSKTKHIIAYSGNCSLWTVIYRGNAENVHQYLKTKNRETGEIKKHWGWIS